MDGIINAAAGIFRIYASGKTFVATYKQGKKSWETGEGWAKTFLLIGGSILAVINLGQMAAQGSEMMAADQAKNAVTPAEGTGTAEMTAKKPSIFDVDGNGRVTRNEIIDAAKAGKIPGIDMNNPDYAGINGWQNFSEDLSSNPEFRALFKNSNQVDRAIRSIKFGLKERALDNLGTSSASFPGNSWFHHAFGLDPSEAEATAKEIARQMGN